VGASIVAVGDDDDVVVVMYVTQIWDHQNCSSKVCVGCSLPNSVQGRDDLRRLLIVCEFNARG